MDRLKYEYKSVKILRGTDPGTKWIADGWEVVDKETGRLRTTLHLRRARNRAGRLKVIGSAAAVLAIAAAIGVGAALEDDESTGARAVRPPAAGNGQPNAAKDEPLTVENDDEFAALLAGPENGPSVAAFVDERLGEQQRVEFDGFVVQVYNSEYDQQDALIQAGTAADPSGPRFNIGSQYKTSLAAKIENLERGVPVVVSGTLGVYEHDESQDTFTEETDLTLIQLVEPQVEVVR